MAGVKESQQGPRFRDAINEAAREGINTDGCLYNPYRDPIFHFIGYGSYDMDLRCETNGMDDMIRIKWYGSYDMDHMIWTVRYGSYDLGHMIWSI